MCLVLCTVLSQVLVYFLCTTHKVVNRKKKKASKERHSIKPTFFDSGFILVISGRSGGESQPQ